MRGTPRKSVSSGLETTSTGRAWHVSLDGGRCWGSYFLVLIGLGRVQLEGVSRRPLAHTPWQEACTGTLATPDDWGGVGAGQIFLEHNLKN